MPVGDFKTMRNFIYIYIYRISHVMRFISRKRKVENPKRETWRGAHKTRNSETENVPRRTAIYNDVRAHKAEITCFSFVASTMARSLLF